MGTVEYIQHHLTNNTLALNAEAQEAIDKGQMTFWALNLDTIAFSLLLGALIVFVAARLGKQLESGTPGGFQNFVESVLDFVSTNVRDAFPGHNPLIAPLALTIFLWVWLMNFMDLIPVDLLPYLFQLITGDSHAYLKVVPTTDLNTPLAMAAVVF